MTSNRVTPWICDSRESARVESGCRSHNDDRADGVYSGRPVRPLHPRPSSTRGRGLSTLRSAPDANPRTPMTTDPLQQLLDDVSLAMNYARAGLVDYGYRLLIEQ